MLHQRTLASFIAALLFAGATAATPAKPAPAQTALKPEQVAELYIAVALRQDVDAAKRLNEYLKPAFGGKDAFDIAALANAKSEMQAQYEAFATQMLKALPKADPARVKPAILAALQRQNAAAADARCRALSSSLSANEYVEGQQIAEVRYECTVPAASSSIEDIMNSKENPAALSTDAVLKNFDTFTRAFDTPQTRTVQGRMNLYGKPPEPWSTGGFSEVIDVVHNAMFDKPDAAQ